MAQAKQVKYSLYGRMGWDSEPVCLYTNLSPAQVALKNIILPPGDM